MNDRPDPLEAELSALCPQPISAELRQRIADRINQTVPARRVRVRLPALAGSLAAACLAAVICWWVGGQSDETPPEYVEPGSPLKKGTVPLGQADFPEKTHLLQGDSPRFQRAASRRSTGAAQVVLPTLLAYQRALADSADELDALLNKHARVMPLRDPELVRVGAFTRSDAALHALLGDD